MIRRKLTAYTLMMIAGICAGYFFTERMRPFSAAGILAGLGTAVFLFSEISSREKKICFIALLAGFLIISANYIHYENAMTIFSPSYEEVCSFSGRILSCEDKGEFLRLTIRSDKDESGHRYKITADFRNQNVRSEDDSAETIKEFIGAKVNISGKVSELRDADNPGCFNYRDYMRSKGIAFRIKIQSIETEHDDSVLWEVKRRLLVARELFLAEFDEDSAGIIRGIVFGDKSEIDEDVLKEFQLNSSGHILAVSGLHIGFLHTLLRLLSAKKRTWPASLFIITVMIIYGEMTLWSSSIIRAIIVLSLSILSVNLRRPFDLLTSLSAAAFIILVYRPYMLFNSGFQLSFAAMSGIALFTEHLRRYTGSSLSVIFSVQIGTVPIIANTFHRINLIAFLINIPIIALSSFIVPACIFFLFLDIFTGFIPVTAVNFIQLLIKVLVTLNHTLTFDGSYSVLTPGMGTARTVTALVLLLILSSELFRIYLLRREYAVLRKSIVLLIVPLIFLHSALHDPFKNDEIVFVAVGQGDCTHVKVGDNDILIDGGGSDYVNTGESILMPYLLSQEVRNIDIALLTHLHKDHYLGISELSGIYPVSAVAIPGDYKESYENNLAIAEESVIFKSDKTIFLDNESVVNISDDVYIEVLWPLADSTKSVSIDDPNEHNMVYMIHYFLGHGNGKDKSDRGEIKIMVTGDLLEEDELKMVKHYEGSEALKCDILKVAHHGSKSSSSEDFIDAASPRIAVIQAGKNNLYGHPHQQTLDRLKGRNIETYRTDVHGAVGIDICRNKIIVDSFK